MNNQHLSAERRAFYQTGLVLLALALFDVMNFITAIAQGDYNAANYAEIAGVEFIRVFLIVMMAIAMLAVLVQVGLGMKALSEAKNPTKARVHLVIAKIIGVLNLLGAVSTIISMFGASVEWNDVTTLIISLIDVVIMFLYAREGAKVRAI